MPDGVFLPNVPSPQVPQSMPVTPMASHDVTDRKPVRATPPTLEEKRKADEVLGQLDAGLRHLIQSYDSDATESSSGELHVLSLISSWLVHSFGKIFFSEMWF